MFDYALFLFLKYVVSILIFYNVLWELQNYNLLLNKHQQQIVESHQKKTPHAKGKGEAPARC